MSALPTPQPDPQPSVDADTPLVLLKNGQRYQFRCEAGQEETLLQQFADMARDPEQDFDWFDAAVLSHQVGQRLSQNVKPLRYSPSAGDEASPDAK